MIGEGLTSQLGAGTSLIGAGSGAISYGSDLISGKRSFNLPEAGEIIGDVMAAAAQFQDAMHTSNDWRVRLSLPYWPSFRNSAVLKPLKEAGGLIFPYTPQIQMSSTATYNRIDTVHTNFSFQGFKNSDPGTITITAPMNVEDQTQGVYWVAAMHYLRSLTKMFSGNDPKAGNPPPIVMLNGYGNYVFKNIPVVVTNFSTTLPNDCDYIGVPVVGSVAGAIAGVSDAVGGVAGAVGSAFGGGVAAVTGGIESVANGVGQAASIASSLGLGGSTSAGTTHVPTKSTFTVTLQPMYSRNSARNFSLDRFVTGGYLNGSFGYI